MTVLHNYTINDNEKSPKIIQNAKPHLTLCLGKGNLLLAEVTGMGSLVRSSVDRHLQTKKMAITSEHS